MKVYLVTVSDYESHDIVGAFLDEKKAFAYSVFWDKTEAGGYGPSTDVEEFETRDDEEIPEVVECYRVDMVGEFIIGRGERKEWREPEEPAILLNGVAGKYEHMGVWSENRTRKPVDVDGDRKFTIYVPTENAEDWISACRIAMKMREDYIETEDREEGV